MSLVVDVVSEDTFYDNLTLGLVRLLGKLINKVDKEQNRAKSLLKS
jgi:hypothetical protein